MVVPVALGIYCLGEVPDARKLASQIVALYFRRGVVDLFGIASRIAESGLVVHENYEKRELYIARPSSLKGTKFRGWKEDQVSGISDTVLKINAPSAKIVISGEGRKTRYLVNISIGAAPGPGPEWFNEEFKRPEDAIKAVLDCYFSDRIDFYNSSLESWYG